MLFKAQRPGWPWESILCQGNQLARCRSVYVWSWMTPHRGLWGFDQWAYSINPSMRLTRAERGFAAADKCCEIGSRLRMRGTCIGIVHAYTNVDGGWELIVLIPERQVYGLNPSYTCNIVYIVSGLPWLIILFSFFRVGGRAREVISYHQSS